MDHNRERAEISAEVYHDGLRRLDLMSIEAAKTAQLGRMKFTAEEVDRAERTLGLGLHLLPAAPDQGSVASSNWLDAGFEVGGNDPDDAEIPHTPENPPSDDTAASRKTWRFEDDE